MRRCAINAAGRSRSSSVPPLARRPRDIGGFILFSPLVDQRPVRQRIACRHVVDSARPRRAAPPGHRRSAGAGAVEVVGGSPAGHLEARARVEHQSAQQRLLGTRSVAPAPTAMSYRYDSDHTSAGDLRLAHRQYKILHRRVVSLMARWHTADFCRIDPRTDRPGRWRNAGNGGFDHHGSASSRAATGACLEGGSRLR